MEEEGVPPWREQITLRALLVSVVLGFVFCLIVHKLLLSVGIVPALNLAAGLLGFFMIRSWSAALRALGFASKPLTRQENTVIQTCIVACYGIASCGGFGTYLLAMSGKMYQLIGPDAPGNRAEDVKELSLGWIILFVLSCSFGGVVALVPLRKIMLIDYKLLYPSGTATAMLINSFHTPAGEAAAQNQVVCLAKFCVGTLLWSAFKWFFSGQGASCGFEHFPVFGLKASASTFYFDFNPSYVAIGLLCPFIVPFSVLLGAIVSWGVLWPLIAAQAGNWFPAHLEQNSFRGLQAYKIFLGTALLLGDGFYNLAKICFITIRGLRFQHSCSPDDLTTTLIEDKKDEVFMKEGVPVWLATGSYLLLSLVSMTIIPLIFHQVKWYYALICYLLAPAFGFCNAYAAGLTDMSMPSIYSKLALFVFAGWAGQQGGVVAGLAASGIVMSMVSSAADLMQDFKTGYLTLASPKSMFVSQLLGTAIGCVVAPLTFWIFWTAFDIGDPNGAYKAPAGVLFRQVAILAVEGVSALPSHCLELCAIFFLLALLLNLARDCGPVRTRGLLPLPFAMGIPFYIGAFVGVDMFLGSLLLLAWRWTNIAASSELAAAAASGLICGDGIWSVAAALLALLQLKPPMCMAFFPTQLHHP